MIKKIGRLIIKNEKHYKKDGRLNPAAQKMMNLLNKKMEEKNVKDLVDGFNTDHLKALFDGSESTSDNLKTTRKLFNKYLRR